MLTFASVAVIVPTTEAAAAQILYKCRKYTWWGGWWIVYTTDLAGAQSQGYTCYCVGTR